jgi:hypothetical protein
LLAPNYSKPVRKFANGFAAIGVGEGRSVSDRGSLRLGYAIESEQYKKLEAIVMSQVTYNGEDIARLGQAIYQKLHEQLESVDNIGKIVAIDIESGDYEIGDDVLVVSDRLKARHPLAEMWAERIGFNAVYSVGGTLTRTTP